MVRVPGAWKNFEEIEDNLTLGELDEILNAARKMQHEQNKFIAAMQGIDLEKNGRPEDEFEAVKRRAEAQLAGMSEEQYEFSQVGIQIEEW